jgi:hypothetical protein
MAGGAKKKAGDDEKVAPDDNLSVIQAVRACFTEADDAKVDRLQQNRINRDAFFGRQDWSQKQDGQSTEFIPKTSTSVEQLAAFIKRGLMKFGDWYSVDLDRSLAQQISGGQVRAILNTFFKDLWAGNNQTTVLPIVISDAVKVGLLESLMIVKVHGGMMPTRKYAFQRKDVTVKDSEDQLQMEETDEWKLRVDLVRTEDYYPDPTGRGLYEIHKVERDLDEVMQGAESGIYDKAAVDLLINTDYKRPEDEERTEWDRNQNETVTPSFRKRVVLTEFWGTLLKQDGTVAHRNIVCTVANDKILIRPPEPNPFWHQESPFCVSPIIRVPFSVWHKALCDTASSLNIAMNEMFNLILDGGMAAVWGVRQLRIEDLEDPSQVEGGIKQGMTLAVKQTLPHNAKVMEVVAEGNVPNDAMAVYEAVGREYNEAMMTNELKLGNLPGKQVRATEIVEASQSQAITLDGIVADIEFWIETIVRKSWLTMLQNADDINSSIMESVIDKTVALLLMRASPEERFALFANKAQFRVFGLSSTMAKALDFQKFMSLTQAVSSNPLLFQAYQMRFSAEKSLRYLMTRLNINPDDIEKNQDEMQPDAQNAEIERTMGAANMIGQAGGGGQRGASAPGAAGNGGAPPGGGSSLPAQINQIGKPATGMPPNA